MSKNRGTKKKKERGKRVNSYFECPRGVFRFFGQITSIQAVIFERRNGATWLKGRTTGVKNKAAHYTQAVHDEYSLRSNESRCSNAGCRKIAALKRGKRRPTEKTRKTANVTCRIPMNFTSTMQLFFSFPLSFSFFFLLQRGSNVTSFITRIKKRCKRYVLFSLRGLIKRNDGVARDIEKTLSNTLYSKVLFSKKTNKRKYRESEDWISTVRRIFRDKRLILF